MAIGSKGIVTILGAGMSLAAGIPSANYLREQLVAALTRTHQLPHHFIKSIAVDAEDFLEKLDNVADDLSFDEACYLWSRCNPDHKDGVAEWIFQYIKPKNGTDALRFFPTFAHEYCAHLAGGNFLRYFISTNFDEILESVLDEEFGPGAFHLARSVRKIDLHGSARDRRQGVHCL